MNFPQLNTSVEELKDPLFEEKGVRLFIKRDDLIHAEISGNKFRKLKYNLLEAQENGYKQILTFGGAFSNHIAASAAAGKLCGIKSIGLIRGDEFSDLNPTLLKAKENGMHLKFVSRQAYSHKNEALFLKELEEEFGKFYHIPEGGANLAAVKGCAEIVQELAEHFDVLCTAVGTGTTLAGIHSATQGNQKALGYSALKGGEFLLDEISNLMGGNLGGKGQLLLNTDYHFGGYAKLKQELVDFCNEFYHKHQIALDLIYTAKMFYGIYDMIRMGAYSRGEKILGIHTGGLQANSSMEKRYKVNLEY